MRIGFTGTRRGMSDLQKSRLVDVLHWFNQQSGPHDFCHGDAVGADRQAAEIAEQCRHYNVQGFSILPSETPLDRNWRLVRARAVRRESGLWVRQRHELPPEKGRIPARVLPRGEKRPSVEARVSGYLRQQYGFGYGRLDVVAKHPGRVVGDTVSPALMMAHPVVLAGGLAVAAVALILWAVGRSWTTAASAAAGVFLALVVERGVAGVRAARLFRDTAPLLFPVVHLARDAAWIAASGVWILRRLARRPGRPWHSMRREAGVDPGTPGEIRS